MKITDQSWAWEQKPPANTLEIIEQAGRVCYQSEKKITQDTTRRFVSMILESGHHSVIEHVSASVRFITSRSVTHELVRHRLISASQESQRYVRYNNLEVIRPAWWDEWTGPEKDKWLSAMKQSEINYNKLLKLGSRPEQAREVLTNSLKTEIIVTANIREWLHIFRLRTSKAAHPQIRALMKDCLKNGFNKEIPGVFNSRHQTFEIEETT